VPEFGFDVVGGKEFDLFDPIAFQQKLEGIANLLGRHRR